MSERVTVATLKPRGLAFEEDDYPDFRTVSSIATRALERVAWFKDTAVIILAVSQWL